MALSSSISNIKRARKEAYFYRTISQLFLRIAQDEPQLSDLMLNRVVLSPSYSNCTVYFYIPEGQEAFNQKLQILKLYKPSIRKAVSNLIPGRHTPDIIFRYDNQYEKQRSIENLLDTIATQEKDTDQE